MPPPSLPLLRKLLSNVRRSLGARAVMAHGFCLLVLIALVAFAASSPLASVAVLGMLSALGREPRGGSGAASTSSFADAHAAANQEDDKAWERLLRRSSHEHHDNEEGTWKSDS